MKASTNKDSVKKTDELLCKAVYIPSIVHGLNAMANVLEADASGFRQLAKSIASMSPLDAVVALTIFHLDFIKRYRLVCNSLDDSIPEVLK